jgi:hypothetical protein
VNRAGPDVNGDCVFTCAFSVPLGQNAQVRIKLTLRVLKLSRRCSDGGRCSCVRAAGGRVQIKAVYRPEADSQLGASDLTRMSGFIHIGCPIVLEVGMN